MGRISKGILGGVSGTVGPVIGGSWKGITYVRSKPDSVTDRNSLAQQEQRAKFRIIGQFLRTMNDLLMITFRSYAVHMTGANSAFSYNIQNAITGSFPAYTINYGMVLVSRGDLPNGGNPGAANGTAGTIKFTWVDNASVGKARGTDKAILVVHCPLLNQTLYTAGGAPRSVGEEVFDVSVFSGQSVETWVAFASADGKSFSDSSYTGMLTVS